MARNRLTHNRSIKLSIAYSEALLDAGIAASVGSKGDAFDNALAETINGLYKTEVINHLGPWRGLADVERATMEWVHWFNTERSYENLGYKSPAEYEMAYHQRSEEHTSELQSRGHLV